MSIQTQYSTDEKLKTRIYLHEHFSTNKQGWYDWVFSFYPFKPHMKILELGSGTGKIWQENINRIPNDVSIMLSDQSDGMVQACQETFKTYSQFQVKKMDITNIEYPDQTFDLVIANHMLYHVNDRKKSLQEVKRVLKPNGKFMATTIGNNNMKELEMLLKEFDSSTIVMFQNAVQNFSLENGEEQLKPIFSSVELIRYLDSLHIDELEPLFKYILTLDFIDQNKAQELKNFLKSKFTKGYIDINKDAGIFICNNK